jgi:predicted acyl esterase
MEQVPHMTQVADVSIRFDVEIQMADDTVLRADVYLPKSLPAPVLISRTPYLKGTIPGIAAAVNPVSAVRWRPRLAVDPAGRPGCTNT